jgi:hypothetical protein
MSDQILERFHRALIEEIQTQRPEYLTAPFTVAEIYQNLVPYGSHRDRIGVEMNGDYEDALVRLLAGEGGYLILDSEPALEDLRAELESPNPNTGRYREFAAVDVRLNQADLDLSASAMDDLPDLVSELEAEDPVAMAALAPSEKGLDLGFVPAGVDIFADRALGGGSGSEPSMTEPPGRPPLAPEFVEGPEAEDSPSGGSHGVAGRVDAGLGECKWCRAGLPERENLNFCPFCGTNLGLVPCPACGEGLEPGWRFCAMCGTEVTA